MKAILIPYGKVDISKINDDLKNVSFIQDKKSLSENVILFCRSAVFATNATAEAAAEDAGGFDITVFAFALALLGEFNTVARGWQR